MSDSGPSACRCIVDPCPCTCHGPAPRREPRFVDRGPISDADRAARASAILGILRKLDTASLDEVRVVDRVVDRFEVLRKLRTRRLRSGLAGPSDLDSALLLELSDLRLERERAEALHEAERDRIVSAGTVTIREGDASWHDGPGWYYAVEDCFGEGWFGAFASRVLAEQHARMSGHRVDEVERDQEVG